MVVYVTVFSLFVSVNYRPSMKFIIKLFPEITIKSKPVRKQFVRQLRSNIRKILQQIHGDIQVIGQWDKIDVEMPEALAEYVEEVRTVISELGLREPDPEAGRRFL